MNPDRKFVLEPQAVNLLSAFNIPYPAHALARDPEEASQIADSLGYPVVLKIVSPDIIHKSDLGGVKINVTDAAQVKKETLQMIEHIRNKLPYARVEGILVCKQALPGLEVIIGSTRDITFGPVVMFGIGGIFTEVMKDVSFRVVPLQRKDAENMLHEIRAYPLLAGARAEAPYDIAALADLLLNVSNMVSAHPEIEELDMNPVRVYEHGLMALDIRLITRIKKDQ